MFVLKCGGVTSLYVTLSLLFEYFSVFYFPGLPFFFFSWPPSRFSFLFLLLSLSQVAC